MSVEPPPGFAEFMRQRQNQAPPPQQPVASSADAPPGFAQFMEDRKRETATAGSAAVKRKRDADADPTNDALPAVAAAAAGDDGDSADAAARHSKRVRNDLPAAAAATSSSVPQPSLSSRALTERRVSDRLDVELRVELHRMITVASADQIEIVAQTMRAMERGDLDPSQIGGWDVVSDSATAPIASTATAADSEATAAGSGSSMSEFLGGFAAARDRAKAAENQPLSEQNAPYPHFNRFNSIRWTKTPSGSAAAATEATAAAGSAGDSPQSPRSPQAVSPVRSSSQSRSSLPTFSLASLPLGVPISITARSPLTVSRPPAAARTPSPVVRRSSSELLRLRSGLHATVRRLDRSGLISIRSQLMKFGLQPPALETDTAVESSGGRRLKSLPLDLWSQCLLFIEFQGIWSRACRVSRSWFRLVYSERYLSRVEFIHLTRTPVQPKLVSLLFARFHSLKHAVFVSMSSLSRDDALAVGGSRFGLDGDELAVRQLTSGSLTDRTLRLFVSAAPSIGGGLLRLELSAQDQLSDDSLTAIGAACHALRSLDLNECTGVGNAGLREIGAGCPELRELRLSGCFRVGDRGIACVAKGCPLLDTLELRRCRSVTDMACLSLALYTTELRHLGLFFCGITDAGVAYLSGQRKAAKQWSIGDALGGGGGVAFANIPLVAVDAADDDDALAHAVAGGDRKSDEKTTAEVHAEHDAWLNQLEEMHDETLGVGTTLSLGTRGTTSSRASRNRSAMDDESGFGGFSNVDLSEDLGRGIDQDHYRRDRLRRANAAHQTTTTAFDGVEDDDDADDWAVRFEDRKQAPATAAAAATASGAALPVHRVQFGTALPSRGVSILDTSSAAAAAVDPNAFLRRRRSGSLLSQTAVNPTTATAATTAGAAATTAVDTRMIRSGVGYGFGFGCSRLQTLNLGGCNISNAGLHSLSLGCTELRSLDLFCCQQITDIGLRSLLGMDDVAAPSTLTSGSERGSGVGCYQLQQLNVGQCSHTITRRTLDLFRTRFTVPCKVFGADTLTEMTFLSNSHAPANYSSRSYGWSKSNAGGGNRRY